MVSANPYSGNHGVTAKVVRFFNDCSLLRSNCTSVGATTCSDLRFYFSRNEVCTNGRDRDFLDNLRHFCLRELSAVSDNTTLHGPKRIYYGKKCSFVFWIMMMIASLVLLMKQTTTLILMYSNHPTVSQVGEVFCCVQVHLLLFCSILSNCLRVFSPTFFVSFVISCAETSSRLLIAL